MEDFIRFVQSYTGELTWAGICILILLSLIGVLRLSAAPRHTPVYMVDDSGQLNLFRWGFRVAAITPTCDPAALKVGQDEPALSMRRIRRGLTKHSGRFRVYFTCEIETGYFGTSYEDLTGTIVFAPRELTKAKAAALA